MPNLHICKTISIYFPIIIILIIIIGGGGGRGGTSNNSNNTYWVFSISLAMCFKYGNSFCPYNNLLK